MCLFNYYYNKCRRNKLQINNMKNQTETNWFNAIQTRSSMKISVPPPKSKLKAEMTTKSPSATLPCCFQTTPSTKKKSFSSPSRSSSKICRCPRWKTPRKSRPTQAKTTISPMTSTIPTSSPSSVDLCNSKISKASRMDSGLSLDPTKISSTTWQCAKTLRQILISFSAAFRTIQARFSWCSWRTMRITSSNSTGRTTSGWSSNTDWKEFT